MRSIRLMILLAAAVATAAGCGSPSKPSPPPDPYPDGPRITCPATPEPVTSTTGLPMALSYGTATATGGAPPVNVACSPASGSLFPIGTTAVTCTATDTRQRSDTCTFNVVITQPPRIQVTRFAAFGDSITWGEDGIASIAYDLRDRLRPRFQVARPYPTALYQQLIGRYTTQPIVVGNFGVPGELVSSADARARFSQLARSGSFDVMLLMEGSNDVNTQSDSIINAAIESLRTMIRDAKSRGVRPYLGTIPPMDALKCCPRRGNGAPLVAGFNSRIAGLGAAENVPVVDIYGALNPSIDQYLGGDGLHPNQSGYEKIADTFFASLRSTLEATPMTALPAVLGPAHPLRPSPRAPRRR